MTKNRKKIIGFGSMLVGILYTIITLSVSGWEFGNPALITQDSINSKDANSVSELGSELSGGTLIINGDGLENTTSVSIGTHTLTIISTATGSVEISNIPAMSVGTKEVLITDNAGNTTTTTIDVFGCDTCRLFDGCPF